MTAATDPGTTVLIVDDDPMVRKLLEHHLTAAGYNVVTATDGRDAIRAMERSEPSLVVTDWEMPEMNGLELCRHLRSFEGLDGVYAIVLTSNSDHDQLIAAFDAGADDYLTKPFDRRELLARLRAGERIVKLERRLAGQNAEIARSKSDLEKVNQQLAAMNGQLHRMARSDDLTGLANRRAAMVDLGDHWRSATRNGTALACIVLDVDRFKRCNDTYGHDAGDIVLRNIAETIRDTARATERVFRLGGEEFLVLCPGATTAMAADAAERMRRAIETLSIPCGDGTLRVTASFGVAERSPEMGSSDDLVKAADDALYDAKHSGRNRVRTAPTTPHTLPELDEDGRQGRASA